MYFEGQNCVVHIFMANGSENRFYGRLSAVEKDLSGGAKSSCGYRQSFLVNYGYIGKMSFSAVTVLMGNGREYPSESARTRKAGTRTTLRHGEREDSGEMDILASNEEELNAPQWIKSFVSAIYENTFF